MVERGIIHVVADRLEDTSALLALRSDENRLARCFHANADEARGPCEDPRDITLRRQAGVAERTAAILPRGRNSQ